MMIKAYNGIYIEDYFVKYFINSNVCKCFEKEPPSYVSEMLGIDLVHNILESVCLS